MDCVGILKLRNADVEKRIGIARAKAKKKNSTKARLVFRVALRKLDGSFITLQTASTPILYSKSAVTSMQHCVNIFTSMIFSP